MAVARNHPRCGVCDSKLVKNGTTSAGRTRWRCTHCGASTTQQRPDITRRAQVAAFHTWLLSTAPQTTAGGTGRSFRAATNWCWNIPVPQPAVTGQVHQAVMLDGTYLQGWCLLIAFDTQHVIAWQWCNRESKAAWTALLERIPAPEIAVIDGGTGLTAALAHCWPHTQIQRCYFHIFQTVTRHLTMNPKLQPGKELRSLTTALMRVDNLDQARQWTAEYLAWEARWDSFLKHRTYANAHRERPPGIGHIASWWFTHRNLRRVRSLFRGLLKHHELFTWLTHPAAPLPRTTSPLEGGPNKAVKDFLRAHRGMPEHHARRGIEWLLNSLTEHPHHPWTLAQPHHWNPPPPKPQTTTEQPDGPQPGTHFSWEDGNHLRHGWAGRHTP